MTREEYINCRNENQLRYELFWEYYCTFCEKPLITDFQKFVQSFTYFNSVNQLMNYKKVLEYYDNLFEVVLVIEVESLKIIKFI
jgi:hypothetical protein